MRYLIFALLFTIGAQAQTFDFSCQLADDNPMKYYNEFIEEAATHGIDFGDQDNFIQTRRDYTSYPVRTITEVSSSSIRLDYAYQGSARANTVGRCKDGYQVTINPYFWYFEPYDEETLNIFRKFIIFHELGHDLLNLGHICRGTYDGADFHVSPDIMEGDCHLQGMSGGSILRSSQDNLHWPQNAKVFEQKIDEMFQGIGQNTTNCN